MSTQDNNVVGRSNLVAALEAYARACPDESAQAQRFIDFVADEPRCYERDCWRGHVTGAAWLLNGAGTHALLTHHRKLNMWLQLGGHSDGDENTTRVALREAREESGLQVRLLQPAIFDIDIHPIPARKEDPDHWHYDVRFLMQVVGGEDFVVSSESLDLAWVPVAELLDYSQEPTILRMGRKNAELLRGSLVRRCQVSGVRCQVYKWQATWRRSAPGVTSLTAMSSGVVCLH